MLISPPRGFSLLEVLIVISIITISTTYAIFSFAQNEKKIILSEADRFKIVFESIYDRAIILKRPMMIHIESKRYYVKERFNGNWVLIKDGFLKPYYLDNFITVLPSRKKVMISAMGTNEQATIKFKTISKKNILDFSVLILIDELGKVSIKNNE